MRSEMRPYLLSQIPLTADDCLHSTYLVLLQAVRAGRLRDPDKLLAYARTIGQRHAIEEIQRLVRARKYLPIDWATEVLFSQGVTPEAQAAKSKRGAIADRLMLCKSFSRPKREVLVRFYVMEQCPDVIQEAMHLTPTQYRLLKTRALHQLEVLTLAHVRRRQP